MAKHKTFQLDIVSQEKHLATEEVSGLTVMTTIGEITVLANHLPLFTKLATGELRFQRPYEKKAGSYAISGGFLEVDPDGNVTILADFALRSDDINVALAQKAKDEAEAALQQKTSRRDFMLAEASLRKALNELKIARKRSAKKI